MYEYILEIGSDIDEYEYEDCREDLNTMLSERYPHTYDWIKMIDGFGWRKVGMNTIVNNCDPMSFIDRLVAIDGEWSATITDTGTGCINVRVGYHDGFDTRSIYPSMWGIVDQHTNKLVTGRRAKYHRLGNWDTLDLPAWWTYPDDAEIDSINFTFRDGYLIAPLVVSCDRKQWNLLQIET